MSSCQSLPLSTVRSAEPLGANLGARLGVLVAWPRGQFQERPFDPCLDSLWRLKVRVSVDHLRDNEIRGEWARVRDAAGVALAPILLASMLHRTRCQVEHDPPCSCRMREHEKQAVYIERAAIVVR